MVIKKIGDFAPWSKRADMPFCVCEHYDDTCSCSVKLSRDRAGKLIPMGIPADDNLKSLRCEAHHYMSEIVALGIMRSNDDIYEWLSRREGIQRSQFHMSMFMEGRCQNIILALLETLSRYPEKAKGKVTAYHPVASNVRAFSESDPRAAKILMELEVR